MILLLCWGTKTYLRNILETSYQLRTTFLFINNGHLGVIKEYVWVYSKNLSPITEGPKGPIMQIVLFQFLHTFLKIGQFRPLFPYFCLLNKVDSKQMLNFADDWIRSMDLWYWKRLLYWLSHVTPLPITVQLFRAWARCAVHFWMNSQVCTDQTGYQSYKNPSP